MNDIEAYFTDRDKQMSKNLVDRDLRVMTKRLFSQIVRTNWVKQFTWMGVPIMQLPTDLMVMQELIVKLEPTCIIETGVAFGGMTLFYNHMLEIMGGGSVIGVDIDIRPHTRKALEKYDSIRLVEGSSIDPKTFKTVIKERKFWEDEEDPNLPIKTLVSLDSHHTHDHVLAELRLYAPLVSVGSFIIVFDTTIEEYGSSEDVSRPWGPGNNPATAVKQFLRETDDFVVDREVEQRALLTAAPGGFLRRIK